MDKYSKYVDIKIENNVCKFSVYPLGEGTGGLQGGSGLVGQGDAGSILKGREARANPCCRGAGAPYAFLCGFKDCKGDFSSHVAHDGAIRSSHFG